MLYMLACIIAHIVSLFLTEIHNCICLMLLFLDDFLKCIYLVHFNEQQNEPKATFHLQFLADQKE